MVLWTDMFYIFFNIDSNRYIKSKKKISTVVKDVFFVHLLVVPL